MKNKKEFKKVLKNFIKFLAEKEYRLRFESEHFLISKEILKKYIDEYLNGDD